MAGKDSDPSLQYCLNFYVITALIVFVIRLFIILITFVIIFAVVLESNRLWFIAIKILLF